MLKKSLLVLSLLIPGYGLSHSGGTDKYGCHTNHSTGEYHCHKAKKKKDIKVSKNIPKTTKGNKTDKKSK